jgi:uncharacterized phage protein (TIGR01671 family)
MSEILFRGKRVDNGEWVYGDLFQGVSPHDRQPYSIILTDEKYDAEGHLPKDIALGFHSDEVFIVDANSVGQFTGLTGKNGKEIYEGDILVWGESDNKSLPLIVNFKHGAFGYKYSEDWFHSFAGNTNFSFNPFNTDIRFEIIGNIHDNPELLKGGGE